MRLRTVLRATFYVVATVVMGLAVLAVLLLAAAVWVGPRG